MAAIPIYNEATLPCLIYPMKNTQEPTKKYLGGKAISGRALATVNLVAESDAEMTALYEFFKTDCNYGLEPFLIPIPFFGADVEVETPAILVKQLGSLETDKTNSNKWKASLKLEILGDIDYVIDGEGNFVLSDSGDFVLSDSGDFVSTGNNVNSYREIFYEN